MPRPTRLGLGLAVALLVGWNVFAADPDLTDYRTPDKAVTTRVAKSATPVASRAGYLGVSVAPDAKGRLAVTEIAAESPAARAGVKSGDLLVKFDGKEIRDEIALNDVLRARKAGDSVKLVLSRQDKPVDVTATLDSLSKPKTSGRVRATLGLQVANRKEGEGLTIEQVVPGSAAEQVKLKAGEVLLKIDDVPLTGPDKLRDLLAQKKPDDVVTLTLLLAEKAVELKVKLSGESVEDQPRGWESRGGRYWTKPVYRVAIIGVEYPDVKHHEKIPMSAWQDSMFSQGTYTKTSVTGQTVYGSMYDYYFEQSYGNLKVEGKAFDYVEVSKKRAEYVAQGVSKNVLLREAMDVLLAREGKDALKDFDGVFFIYAGDRHPSPRGSLYWPHRSSFEHNRKTWPYFICQEQDRGQGREGRQASISVFCHEFGHMLGLPDLYARPENPGMEGVGVWCAMANQAGNGRPQHFCAWSKEKLGWVKPAVIDPTVKQKLVLSPIEDDPKQCFKVLVRPDGSEYLLLENRGKKGFDKSLPADGLLIWRVVGNRPILQESHGVEGASGPRVFLNSVPYPSTANDAYTPFTTPSSRSQLGGGLPVHITNITRLADGRITFHVGYEYE